MGYTGFFAFLGMHETIVLVVIFTPITSGLLLGLKHQSKSSPLTRIQAIVICASFFLFMLSLGIHEQIIMSPAPMSMAVIGELISGLATVMTIFYAPYKIGEWIGWKRATMTRTPN